MPYTIATLDTETLSFHPNAVIHEIGVIVTNFVPTHGVQWGLAALPELRDMIDPSTNDLIFDTHVIYTNVLEQVMAGCVVDPATVQFHRGVFEKRRSNETFDEYLQGIQIKSFTREQTRRALKRIWNGYQVKETWINHPAFDVPRICRVIYEDAINPLPWKHQEEFDVATAKQMYRNKLNVSNIGCVPPLADMSRLPANKDIHGALADCLYNLAMIGLAQPWLK